jgi:DNA-binding beta-propeller fold protein YncE
VLVIDLAARKIADILDLGSHLAPHGMVTTRDGAGLVWLIDAAEYRRQAVVAKGPMGIAIPPDGRTVVVSSHDSGLLTRIDLVAGDDGAWRRRYKGSAMR